MSLTQQEHQSIPTEDSGGFIATLKLWLRPQMLMLHVFAVLAVLVCVVAALWQLGVYEARQGESQAERSAIPAVPIESIWGPDEVFTRTLTLRTVTVAGQFEAAEDQFWVSGKSHGDEEGYWLVAPLRVDGASLLIVRGWAPEPTELPDVPGSPVVLDAVIHPTDGPGGLIDPVTRVTESIRIPSLINELPYDLWSGYALSTTDTRAGLELPEVPAPQVSWTTGGRNLGYTLQWWAFAAFAIFMWWRMSKESVALARADEVNEDTVDK